MCREYSDKPPGTLEQLLGGIVALYERVDTACLDNAGSVSQRLLDGLQALFEPAVEAALKGGAKLHFWRLVGAL